MIRPTVRVVGLGPAGAGLMTQHATALLANAPVARLRTRHHPAAEPFANVGSYDDLYESAESFDDLYRSIADDLVRLASTSVGGEVVYAVPGSPLVAERTVEILRERDVTLVVEPAVSVIDVACAALGRDPMSVGLRVVDALGPADGLAGPGPLLVLQTYRPEILADVADRLDPATMVTILHHLGLDDAVVEVRAARELATFPADHLTSLWIDEVRDVGVAAREIVDLMRRLRRECPWDVEQTHDSLLRHLVEESYEALDALETLVREEPTPDAVTVAHVEEELGDLLLQVVFHAELGDEMGRFDLRSIIEAQRAKLIGRHPHVFAGVRVAGAEEVAARWEVLKQAEKGRRSATEGVPLQLPGLTLYAKLLRHGRSLDVVDLDLDHALTAARGALAEIGGDRDGDDAAWSRLADALARAAALADVDLEGAVRARALALKAAIEEVEQVR